MPILFMSKANNYKIVHPVKYKIFDFVLSPKAKDLTGLRKI